MVAEEIVATATTVRRGCLAEALFTESPCVGGRLSFFKWHCSSWDYSLAESASESGSSDTACVGPSEGTFLKC